MSFQSPKKSFFRRDSIKLLLGTLAMLMVLGTACQSSIGAEVTATAVSPTENVAEETAAEPTTVPGATEAAPTSTLAPTSELAATATPDPTATATQPVPTATSEPAAAETAVYQVAFVTEDDVLNVRSGPGVSNEKVGSLPPDATGVQITGAGQVVAGSTWVPIQANGLTGWVNSGFLTQQVSEDAFCDDTAVTQLLQSLETAVANRDGQALARLVHPERGLRIHRHWWNPEVQFQGDEIPSLFTSQDSVYWGTADGTGDAINSSFSEIILPLLDTVLTAENRESACNEILNGGTAGIVRLPDGYEPVNFYSFYRPGTEEYGGLNWGAWVVGVERWQGNYFVSYLVHFEWEI